ncbi:protein kinase domain-containing protein [Tundrisphaera lichenicola]|uniref:serine/threonine-protein kinase n=1 Tax=Tundrisphaera lichenicola TaxID=2029860 RepID=UPI003EB704A2
MAADNADRNLLFGILALQMDFITRDGLVEAMNAWILRKQSPLGEILAERGDLASQHRAVLELMVDAYVDRHGGGADRGLAALSSVEGVASDLRRSIADAEVHRSLAHVAAESRIDPYLTRTARSTGPAGVGSRFRKIREHARGGLGVVFIARDDELNRDVALKEIQDRHADLDGHRAKFLLEAEITGRLEHPGIVPVYGLGHHVDGRPFYAMRFIKGDSLKDAIVAFHADEAIKASPGARVLALQKLLRRFLDVCNAIEYAHSRGVLHRDLKPDNVMVGQYGETLVVDWGLAKTRTGGGSGEVRPDGRPETILVPATASGTDETLPGTVVGTPAFMSPEQAEGRLDLLGPASDVYSLGATLYSLLTGMPPFSGKDLAEVLEKVRRGEFRRPRDHARWLELPLEAICLKAMSLQPGRRYESPRTLAEDVQRWLADEPVSAHREGWATRVLRWSRRHRSLVLASCAGASVLLVNLALIGWLQIKAAERARLFVVEQGRRRAEHQRAEEKERTSRVLTNFLVKLFQATDPLGLENRGFRTPEERVNSIEALRMLEAGVQQVNEPDATDREGKLVRATLLDTIGNALRATADFRRARPLLEEALRIRRDSLGSDEPDVAISLFHLAMLDHFSGRFDDANALYLDVEGRLARSAGADDLLIDRVEFHHAWALAEMQRLAESAMLIDRVLARRRRLLGPDHIDTRHAQFASHMIKLGTGDRSILLREAAKIMFSKDPIMKGVFQYYQADTLRKQADRTRDVDDVKRARQALEDILALARASLPPRHFALALLLGDMAEFERNHDNFPRAVDLIREAFEIARQTAPTHPYFIDALAKYAGEMAARQRYDEAERALTEALDAIIDRDERSSRDEQFRDYLGRLLRLPQYRENPDRLDVVRKKYE